MKLLFVRLSSFGDVVLSLSALNGLKPEFEVHVLTLGAYAGLFEGHPSVRRVWTFEKSLGLKGWLNLCQELSRVGFDRVIDLHRSLRSAVLKWIMKKNGIKNHQILSISKQTVRRFGLILTKGLWPKSLRPIPWNVQYDLISSEWKVERRESLITGSHLLTSSPHLRSNPLNFIPASEGGKYFCVMPSSQWEEKNWEPEKYVDLIEKIQKATHRAFVVLGIPQDQPSVRVFQLALERKLWVYSAIQLGSFATVAQILKGAEAVLCGDTGIAHLSESIGTPVAMIFGPTHPDLGFGPKNPKSVACGLDLWCRPCGRDGTKCFRPIQKQKCLRDLTPLQVWNQLPDQPWKTSGTVSKAGR